MKNLDAQSVDIPCPQCGQKTAKSVGWLKTQSEFACAGCGQTIHVAAEEFRAGIKSVEDALARLGRSLGKR